MIRAWQELSPAERTHVLWTVVLILAATTLVLYAIAASRGHDVDYFKERLGLMEQRLNYMDQKVDKVNLQQQEQIELAREQRRAQEQQQRQLEDHQKWIDHWKSLPTLPKPPAKR